MTEKFNNKRFIAQDSMYEFPYHHLPEKISESYHKTI